MHARRLDSLLALALPAARSAALTPVIPAQRPTGRQIPLGPMIERAYRTGTRDSAAYLVDGTVARVRPSAPILPGATATIDLTWKFEGPNVPEDERGERLGQSIAHVMLDPENRFQDLDRTHNEWNAKQ